MRAARMDIVRVVAIGVVADGAIHLVLDDLGKADDRVQRRAQLVTHGGEELGLGAIAGLGRIERDPRLLFRSLDRELAPADLGDVVPHLDRATIISALDREHHPSAIAELELEALAGIPMLFG